MFDFRVMDFCVIAKMLKKVPELVLFYGRHKKCNRRWTKRHIVQYFSMTKEVQFKELVVFYILSKSFGTLNVKTKIQSQWSRPCKLIIKGKGSILINS